MEPMRALSSVELRALVSELRAYQGAMVDKAYLYGDGLVRLRMRDHDRGRIELLIEVTDIKRVHVTKPEHLPAAPDRPPDFARKLRSRIGGATLVDVEQFGFDRILVFTFERSGERATLVAELFGDGNVALLDETRRVSACLATVRLQSRTVVPGADYEFPETRFDPLAAEYAAFEARMTASESDLVRTLATQLNLGGKYSEEVCARAGVDKTRSIADATEDEYRSIFEELSRLARDIETGRFEPLVYYDGERRVDVAPFPLQTRDEFDAEGFETFNAAVDDYFTHFAEDRNEANARPDFEGDIETQERIIAQQEDAIDRFDAEAAAEREKAELLYANYELVDEILATVREARQADRSWSVIEEKIDEGAERGIAAAEAVVGVDPQAGTVAVRLNDHVVELDPTMGVEKNADRLYTAAKDIEEKQAGAREALSESREKLAVLKDRRDNWEADQLDEDAANGAQDVDWLTRASIPIRSPDHWYTRFRWFHTSDEFLVIGGRNADQNEELVRKYLEPHDRFFHTQTRGAPATILKATGPNERAREVEIPPTSLQQAAQFAVSYSSLWKDGLFSGDAYMVGPEQVTKTPESGEYIGKGAFVIRGDRTYFEDVPVGCAVGIQCDPETRVIGGPPDAIRERAETAVAVEPGEFAQGDVAKRIYRGFREHFRDTSFVRRIASPDEIALFLPPGTSRIIDD